MNELELKNKLLTYYSKEELVDLIISLRQEILNLYNADMVLVMQKIANINHMIVRGKNDENNSI